MRSVKLLGMALGTIGFFLLFTFSPSMGLGVFFVLIGHVVKDH